MAEPYFETARSLIDYYLLINNLSNLPISLMGSAYRGLVSVIHSSNL